MDIKVVFVSNGKYTLNNWFKSGTSAEKLSTQSNKSLQTNEINATIQPSNVSEKIK